MVAKFKVGDRVILIPSLTKGLITVVSEYKSLYLYSLSDGQTHLGRFFEYQLKIDIQYYRDDILDKILC